MFTTEANIAKDLGYGDEVAKRIKKAKTQREVDRILCEARYEAMKKERRY